MTNYLVTNARLLFSLCVAWALASGSPRVFGIESSQARPQTGEVFAAAALFSDSAPTGPVILRVEPAPGFVTELSSVSVTFSEPVTGVRAGEFLVNGIPADGLTGTGAAYTFFFPRPGFGPVDISWGTLHTIMTVNTPAVRFDGGAPGATWAYQIVNPNGPSLRNILPIPGSTLRHLAEVEITFNEPVSGVDATDLRMNNTPATEVRGIGAGPYRFIFPEAAAGEVNLAWAANHGIVSDDIEPLNFQGYPWKYQVRPELPQPQIVISEIMAENQTGLTDEEKDPEDWIELHNRGGLAIDLAGWSFSVDREDASQWVFPSTVIPPGGYLVVWASGKDRRDSAPGQRLHTNFKLNPTGDTLQLFGPELPRVLIDKLAYPEQSPNHSFGRQTVNGQAALTFFREASPGAPNTTLAVAGKVAEVHFSVKRGFFNAPFSLSLASATSGAAIRYTLDGSAPSPTNGIVYAGPISITATRTVRAAAFAPDHLPSQVRTHTYLMNLAANRRRLPVISIVIGTNHLYGRNGIMEYNPRNTTKHGPAWERPVSVEWIRPADNGGFQIDAGIRVAGGDYIRGLYNYRTTSLPQGKYSFRLYFRGDYGPGRLDYPIFPRSTLESYNTLHLRAGMNDHSNPFIKDEFIRALSLDTGIVACHGTFVSLYLNGVYKGLYNPTERVDDDFLQAYHGGGELWDVLGPNNTAIRGDTVAWTQLRSAARKDLTLRTNYLDVAARMDLENYIDYLLPLIWADNDDWPHNNTRAARERKPGAKFRFYPWDAEFAFSSHPVTYDTIATTLSSLSPPWGTTDYQAMFNSLKKSPEFKLLFADRVHRAFFNGGPLTDARIRARYNAIKAEVSPSIPGFDDMINAWINSRRRYVTNSFQRAGFLASSNAPVASQFGGRVPVGYPLTLSNLAGEILYTTDGTDPRVPFAGGRSPSAVPYTGPLVITQPTHLKARSLQGTNWSAIIDVTFDVRQMGSPLRITEIQYNPPGGDSFEFIEIQNTGVLTADLSGFSFDGINFRFPDPFPFLAPGARLVLANDARPADFQLRYPNVTVAGWFGGSLDNGGERIALLDATGRVVTATEYNDDFPWPPAADGTGASLELISPSGDSDDGANWQPSPSGGTPGANNLSPSAPAILINEISPASGRDWIELINSKTIAVDLGGWSLSDNSNARQFQFPAGTILPAGGFLVVQCALSLPAQPGEAPFQLSRTGETIILYDAAGNRADALTYGLVPGQNTLARLNGKWTLGIATPSAANLPADLGALASVKINEFMANPDKGEDWIELFNSDVNPVSLQDCALMTSNAFARVASPVFVGPKEYIVLRAEEGPAVDQLDLKLPAEGGLIALLAPNGDELDRWVYPAQSAGVSTGRLPDGSGAFRILPFSSTPGTTNYLADLGTRLRMTEVLAHATPGPDWIEIENVSTEPILLAGHSIGFQSWPAATEEILPLRADSRLNPGERVVLYFGQAPPGFSGVSNAQFFQVLLNDQGGVIQLRDSQERVIDRVAYGLQIKNQSIGRSNPDWILLASPSPGLVNGSAAILDAGTALKLNEWFAGTGPVREFIELYNAAPMPVHLGRWTLTDDPSMSGSAKANIAPLTFIAPNSFVHFYAENRPDLGSHHLGFELDRLGETIRLLNPAGQIVDTIDFGIQFIGNSEGRYPDGTAQVLRFPGSISPSATNYLRPGDFDRDGIEDPWELLNGLQPDRAGDALEDQDGDGMSNLQEFLARTDPRNASSDLRLQAGLTPNGTAILKFIAQPGIRYEIESSDNLTSPWMRLQEFPADNNTREINFTDSSTISAASTRFYRVIIR